MRFEAGRSEQVDASVEAADVVRGVVLEYFRCVNEEDWAGLSRLWAADAELVGVGGRPRHGVDDIVTGYKKFFARWATHHDEPTRILVSGATVTVEVSFAGSTADDKAVTFEAVDVIDIDERGSIRRLTNWYDSDRVRSQLGGAPSFSARAKKMKGDQDEHV